MPAILPGTRQIEVVTDRLPTGNFRFAIFDFDGTLSLIREGWREIMIPTMVDTLSAIGTSETVEDLTTVVSKFVDALTGQQTIYQMIRLCEEITVRGGQPEDPLVYKERYHRALLDHINARIRALRTGLAKPEDFIVPESRALLQALVDRGLTLYLASGTDHDYVVQEAELLGVTSFFGDRIFGAVDNYEDFSKEKLIQQILQDPAITGDQLLGFGDGYVEIENVSKVGGTAVGVASNEATGVGFDAWKRTRLIDARADYMIPEYREQDLLLAHLFPE